MYQKQSGGCPTAPVALSLSMFGFFVLDRTARTAPAERERTGATPIFCRWRGTAKWGVWHQVYHLVSHTPPAVGGVAPARNYPCGKTPTPADGCERPRRREARCVTGFSARFSSSAASVPWPRGRDRACAARPIPWTFWCAMTRRMVPRPCCQVRCRAERGRTARRPICCRHVSDLVRQDGCQVGVPRAPSPMATFAHVRRPIVIGEGLPCRATSGIDPMVECAP